MDVEIVRILGLRNYCTKAKIIKPFSSTITHNTNNATMLKNVAPFKNKTEGQLHFSSTKSRESSWISSRGRRRRRRVEGRVDIQLMSTICLVSILRHCCRSVVLTHRRDALAIRPIGLRWTKAERVVRNGRRISFRMIFHFRPNAITEDVDVRRRVGPPSRNEPLKMTQQDSMVIFFLVDERKSPKLNR